MDNARAGTEFSVNWVNKTLKSATERNNRFLMFCDNLSAKVTENFKDAVSSNGGLVCYGVPNATDLCGNE